MRALPAHRHVIVFAKAPRLGRVKTRLARDIGLVGAWRFYHLSVAGVVRRLAADPRWRVWLAITPDRAPPPPSLQIKGVGFLPQGRGDLGARMGRALSGDLPGAVVIIGGDIPGVRAAHIWRAFQALAGGDYVFGPATDGGYWLVGAEGRGRTLSPLRPHLFQNVRWSSADALADTLANVRTRDRVDTVDTLSDVDEGADLA